MSSWSPLARGKVFENNVLQKIAQKHEKSVAQVCLRWIMQQEVIVIPKSSSSKRIKENIDIFDFQLTKTEMEQIDNLPQMGFSGEHPNFWPDRIN